MGLSVYIGSMHTSITPVGSRVTCYPAPTDTDRDWLVLVPLDKANAFASLLIDSGWTQGGSDIPDESNETDPDDRFHSYTLGFENLIVTSSETFHRRFLAATSVAKLLNLQDKVERIALFQAVLYANACQSSWVAACMSMPDAAPDNELFI